MSQHWRPLPDDPDGPVVAAMFDAGADWLLTAQGDYQTAAAEAMRADGTDLQVVVILEWPTRRNHSDELVMVRLMMSPEDAWGLAGTLETTAEWLMKQRGGGSDEAL